MTYAQFIFLVANVLYAMYMYIQHQGRCPCFVYLLLPILAEIILGSDVRGGRGV